MSKRISLFLATNLLVMLSISILFSFLDRIPVIHRLGLGYSHLAIYCLLWGFGGAFISLAMSRIVAKKSMGVEIVPANSQIPEFKGLIEIVYSLSRKAGLKTMPEVGIYASNEINAFATGPTRNRALVCISTGLANSMDANQIYGVLAHEIAHVANGDMVTMTLIQGIVNSFVLFLSRAISSFVSEHIANNVVTRFITRYFLIIVLEIVLSLFGSMVVCWFSRQREFRADYGGAELAGRGNMISALEALRVQSFQTRNEVEETGLAAMKIYGRTNKFAELFSTHPSLDTRISKLKSAKII